MWILYALILGLFLFSAYALAKGFSVKETLSMWKHGILTARNVLITFLLIGILTALWRAAGTIPVIVCYAQTLMVPSLFYVMTFLLCSAVSALTGTSFGTAATMGVVCAAMSESMHLPIMLTGGAILSGAFFGDRCSPVSTSALLVSELTQTNIFDNIRNMIRTAFVPFLLTCLIYTVLGITVPHTSVDLNLTATFGQVFRLHWAALAPAVLILLLSIFRIPVKKTMTLSILAAIPVCLLLQHISVKELLQYALLGFHTANETVGPMINGGGILSMIRVSLIVCISSAYSGIFRETGILNAVYRKMSALSARITPFGAMMAASVSISAIACNQTLTIMLTKQLCETIEQDKQKLAVDLENTAVLIAALIPWSIAGAVPLSAVNAPTASLLYACFLYIVPLYNFLMEIQSTNLHLLQ